MPKPIEIVSDAPTQRLTSIQRSLFEAEVIEQIRLVFDPEIPVNVYDLGLIYDIQVDDDKNVNVMMTLTSPACPVAGSLPGEVESAVRGTPGIGEVSVELTWDPPFTIDRMSEDVKLMLGID